jgi:hypothetical protein
MFDGFRQGCFGDADEPPVFPRMVTREAFRDVRTRRLGRSDELISQPRVPEKARPSGDRRHAPPQLVADPPEVQFGVIPDASHGTWHCTGHAISTG